MSVILRPATPADVLFIARGFHTAMLYDDAPESQIRIFAQHICTRDDVLYSYRNTLIAESEGQSVGMLTSYDGRYYHEWRITTMALIKQYLGVTFENMEDEAILGEYYLDSLAVVPEHRGKGIGRALLWQGMMQGLYRGLSVTLAVDPVNEKAQRLYASLGFQAAGKLFIFGHDYWKMAFFGDIVQLVRESTRITEFQRRVYLALLEVKRGTTTSYGALAERVGCKSAQAVGQALRCNPFAPAVPCHRVLSVGGSIGGFNGHRDGEAIERKRQLLREEGVQI